MPVITGVYQFRNVKNGRAYIGSTIRSFDERKAEHIELLAAGKHKTKRLQEEWDEYGPDAFVFEPIETLEALDQVLKREHEILRERREVMGVDNVYNYHPAIEGQHKRATLPDRVHASIPANDPRFAGLRAELAEAQSRGSGSPIPRMVGEYAKIGWLFLHGKLGGPSEAPDLAALGIADQAERERQRQEIAAATSGLDFT
jgi:hypothetical protein